MRQVKPERVFDRNGFEDAINKAEAEARGLSIDELPEHNASWGGPANLVVSPQGAGYGTKLSKEIILGLVRTHLESGIVT